MVLKLKMKMNKLFFYKIYLFLNFYEDKKI